MISTSQSYSKQWQAENARFLAEGLTWLRSRLENRLTPPLVVESASASEKAPEPGGVAETAPPKSKRKRTEPVSPSVTESPAPAASHLPGASSGVANQEPPALIRLAQRLSLSAFELDLLFLCIAMELDGAVPRLCARAQDDDSRPYPTFALAFTIFDEPSWDALSPDRPLRYWRLIEIAQGGMQPLTTSCLRVDERILHFAKGLDAIDDRVGNLFVPFQSKPITSNDDLAGIPASQLALARQIAGELQRISAVDGFPLVHLAGSDASSAQLIARKVASDMGLTLFRIPISLLPPHASDLDAVARLWNREVLLGPVALYLDHEDTDAFPAETQAGSIQRICSRAIGIIFFAASATAPRTAKATITYDVSKPTAQEQREAWRQAVGEHVAALAGELASQFHFSVASIGNIASSLPPDSGHHESELRTALWHAARIHARPKLDALAQRVDAKAKWDDIVLPAEQAEQLRRIVQQVRGRAKVYEDWGFSNRMNRGLGITALFAGGSGTGKSTAAEVIANDLELNLYRIDLSAVVSKYIGETEKNLRRLFDAAEGGGAILLFDEADALFGKRSEVKDSHDRYANIEINYLLQRMESYRGLAILATNMRSALDTAFTRRLRFIVNFSFPTVADRKRIWERAFPPETPTYGLNFDRLARLNLTGGNIHSSALNAAFLAAHHAKPVTMPLVLSAVRSELLKLDRPVNEAELRWTEVAEVVA